MSDALTPQNLSRRTLIKGSIAAGGLAALGLGSQTLTARAANGVPDIYDLWAEPYGINEGWESHRNRGSNGGIDYSVPQGTPLAACMEGTTRWVSAYGDGSSSLIIRHDSGWESEYLHCTEPLVANGTRVKIGDHVALSGGRPGTHGAGPSTGAHLHWHLNNPDGTRVNPLDYAKRGPIPPSKPTPTPQWLIHHLTVGPKGWNYHDTGITIPQHAQFTACSQYGSAVGMYIADNQFHMINAGKGFEIWKTGHAISNGSVIGAVMHASNSIPQAFVVERGKVSRLWWAGGKTGFQRDYLHTDVSTNSTISAIDLGPSMAPQALINSEGDLRCVWSPDNGKTWHNQSTKVGLIKGSTVSAFHNGKGSPEAAYYAGGRVQHIYKNGKGWVAPISPIQVNGPADLSVARTKRGVRGLLVSRGAMYDISLRRDGEWDHSPINRPMPSGTRLYCVDAGNGYAQAYALSPVMR